MFTNQPEQSPGRHDGYSSFQEVINEKNSGSLPDMTGVLDLIERLQEQGNTEELLAGQGFLISSFARYSFEEQQHFVMQAVERLEQAIEHDRAAETIPELGYLAIARDFGTAPSQVAREFWQETIQIVQNLYREMQEHAENRPAVWRQTVEALGPGMAWLEVPFGATEETLEEISAPKLLEDHYLTISMRKLDHFINGELGVREFFGPGAEMEHAEPESARFVVNYDNATTVEEKTRVAAEHLAHGFAIDLPGELEIVGEPEALSARRGRIQIRCTTRARNILRMAQIVDGVKRV